MHDRLRFYLNRIGERLWIKPLAMSVLALAVIFIAKVADNTELGAIVPDIPTESISTLLSVFASSMLGIATFSVASMVSAYASASSTATPRSFSLIIADDVSQNALSAFVGAFIFSIIALIAIENSYYGAAGRFTLFAMTLTVFAIVIVTFVRWVDSIARLGRLGSTIDKVEEATASSLKRLRTAPTLQAMPIDPHRTRGQPVYATSIGYVQRVDIPELQEVAEEADVHIEVAARAGAFVAPGQPIAYVSKGEQQVDAAAIEEAFLIGGSRTFDDDPRFGLIVLSEIASRALSPGINDPGTAIDVIGTLVRLFAILGTPVQEDERQETVFDRVSVSELSLLDMFDDAFSATSRDGAGTIEVVLKLQNSLAALASLPNAPMQEAASHHARKALARAEKTLEFPDDLTAALQATNAVHAAAARTP